MTQSGPPTELKLCINCMYFLENEVHNGDDRIKYGHCSHPSNVLSRWDFSPIDGTPIVPPEIKYQIESAKVIRMFGACGADAKNYQPIELKTLVTSSLIE